jgi:hypothetical protein
MMRRVIVLAAALAAVFATVGVVNAQAPSLAPTIVRYPAGYTGQIFVGTAQIWPVTSPTTTRPATTTTTGIPVPTTASTTVAPSSTSTSSTSTTVQPTSTTVISTTSTTSTTSPGSTACGSAGAVFCESFSDAAAFAARFDHGWSGELHAGSAFGGDKNGWPGDHDMSCGNPNMSHRTVTIGDGHVGQDSPAAASDPAFYSCLPSDDPAKGHVMTSANTEGYVIAWFSPKPTYINVRKVCFDNNLNYIGNGIWFQLVFVTQAEAARKPVVDGRTFDVLDLGFTSPDFPNNTGGPSTVQGTASAGIKFQVDGNDSASSRFLIRPWANNTFSGGTDSGPGTSDKAPRYQICVSDNDNGTLTIVNASPDGTVHTNTMAGSIPNGPVRVVFEHDEYNPDKHHDNNGGIATNTGEGYTYHWDNTIIYTR